MRRILFILVIFQLSSFSLFSQGKNCPPILVTSVKDLPFADGESLSYSVIYNWGSVITEVGEAQTSLRFVGDGATSPYFHAVVKGNTYKFFDMFFKVRDHYESKFYAADVRPFYFHRNVNEGKYRMKNTFTWFPDYSLRSVTQKYDNPQKDTLLRGTRCTYDILTMFYYARNIDFSRAVPGEKQSISFVIDDEIFDIYYRYLGREVKKVPGMGTYTTIKFAAKLVAGTVFRGDKEMIIWVTDDANKIPLTFEMEIIVGKVYGRLKATKNLKYALTSRIK